MCSEKANEACPYLWSPASIVPFSCGDGVLTLGSPVVLRFPACGHGIESPLVEC